MKLKLFCRNMGFSQARKGNPYNPINHISKLKLKEALLRLGDLLWLFCLSAQENSFFINVQVLTL